MHTSVIHIETLGCKLNQIESESIASRFTACGFTVDMKPIAAAQAQDRQVLFSILNTCTVTGKAEQKARRIIRLLQTSYPDAAVIVTGCYAELDQKTIEELGANVLVVPGSAKHCFAALPQYLLQNGVTPKSGAPQTLAILKAWTIPRLIIGTKKNIIGDHFKLAANTFTAHSRAALKIQDGCGGTCSYCRVRLARGKPVSLDANSVLQRVLSLEKDGHREIVLTGVNLSQYSGQTANGSPANFAALLDFLLKNTATVSFRLSSLHPEHVDDELCAVLTHKRIRPHFHLSVQSGSDRILAAMCRPYTHKTVLDAACALRKARGNPFLACDIITGFPGETEDDFKLTEDLCKEAQFAGIHAFPFSPRPGTEAFSMKNTVPQHLAGKRVEILAGLAAHIKKGYVNFWIGKTLPGIIEKGRTQTAKALTENFLHVELAGLSPEQVKPYAAKEVPLRITGALPLAGRAEETEAIAEFDL